MAEHSDLLVASSDPRGPEQEILRLGAREVPLRFIRNDAARRYILRLAVDGSARVTVPLRGSVKAAREFAHRHLGWLEKQVQRQADQPVLPANWAHGMEILFRGEHVRLEVEPDGRSVRFADQRVALAEARAHLRPAIEHHLRRLASVELPARTIELAAAHQLAIRGVSVRNQRARWGSCSAKRTVSLNWRLILAPLFVRDYIILHELMHLREMNHSARFWGHVAHVCPSYREAEHWLKQHAGKMKLG